MDISTTSNPFILLAEASIRRGEDMEHVARQLAYACSAVIHDGLGDEYDEVHEFERLIKGGELPPEAYGPIPE